MARKTNKRARSTTRSENATAPLVPIREKAQQSLCAVAELQYAADPSACKVFAEEMERIVWKHAQQKGSKYRQRIMQLHHTWIHAPAALETCWNADTAERVRYIVRLDHSTWNEIQQRYLSPHQDVATTPAISETQILAEIQKVTMKSILKPHELSLGFATDVRGDVRCRNKQCLSYNIAVQEVQTRGADEPADTFCMCRDCSTRWKLVGTSK